MRLIAEVEEKYTPPLTYVEEQWKKRQPIEAKERIGGRGHQIYTLSTPAKKNIFAAPESHIFLIESEKHYL
jgi:hypothetical protein